MKTDWHRYNLKRRVTQLPPVDEETFKGKVVATEAKDASSTEENKGIDKSRRKNERAAKKELLRQQREALLKGIPGEIENEKNKSLESSSEDAELNNMMEAKINQRVEIKPTTCLFCSDKKQAHFDSVEENISHMTKIHGLFLPEKKYLVDVEGLIVYLGEKLGLGNVCLSCSYQGKSLAAVREHMHSKRHIRIPYESDEEKLEISDFYDFTSSYKNDASEFQTENDEEDWEDVSETDFDDKESDDEDSENDLTASGEDFIINLGDELILPNGLSLGHRRLRKLRKQKQELILSEGQGTVVAAECRQLSFQNSQVTKEQQQVWKSEKRMYDLKDRRSSKYVNNQPHFRDQLLQ
ncbi:uncharacterized protein CXQ87_004486 [Candidozyma duobushaemuli]|uniref:ZN622/Rei1/Reh1 zinc finger C2H2-type domain-containing protein n=2 Tax=Candidozyma TaxID=3303203 RepID=A0ABX8IB41_9ASCO|nr:uncharacterized protein CXQ87_004486 [[Candida] duobushaemulonis]PVH16928.1 hypothetical protein CXQ87_004486 [[Candida] duobushaemulonis]QWU89708.1 hypothetical protein CA3LBN_004056 [[Candida] haemuloni]